MKRVFFNKGHKIYDKMRSGATLAVFVIVLIAFMGILLRRLVFISPIIDSDEEVLAGGETNKEFDIKVEPISAEQFTKPSDESEFKVFSHPEYGFSVDYPRELRVLTFDEGGRAETILFQHPTDKNKGFQIYISPYDGNTSLTAKKIKEIQPFTRLDDPKNISIAGTAAVLFWSATEVGQTREVWFAKDGLLYSITTYAPLDAWLSQVMASWRFQ
jgi:hypothetical protein